MNRSAGTIILNMKRKPIREEGLSEHGLREDAAMLEEGRGNQAGSQPCWFYRLDSDCGVFLKWGISQAPFKRYTPGFMRGKRITLVLNGPRHAMLKVERIMVEYQPGPMNGERWAKPRLPEQPRPARRQSRPRYWSMLFSGSQEADQPKS